MAASKINIALAKSNPGLVTRHPPLKKLALPLGAPC